MSFLFAAIVATITALVEATLAPYFAIGAATPHPLLVGCVVWTIAAGVDRGITWAFVGGVVLDSLLGRPLGVSAFALLIAAGGAALLAQPFPRLRLIAPVIAVPILSIVSSVITVSIITAARPGAPVPEPFAMAVPEALYDGILGLFIGPIAVVLHDRRLPTERVDWA